MALVICAVHVATLLLLLGLGFLYVAANGLGELPQNLAQPFPDINTVRLRRRLSVCFACFVCCLADY